MPALLLVSLYMWLLILLKSFQFINIRKNEKTFETCVSSFRESAVYAGADWQKELFSFGMSTSFMSSKQRKRALEKKVQRLTENISKSTLTIMVLAGVAPLFGLFGTVTGMIDTFDVISIYGTGNPKAMASGISVALITTQAGLVVAVPGLIMGNFLMRRSNRIGDRIQLFAHMLVKELENDK